MSDYVLTKSCGLAEVVGILNKSKAIIRFVDTGYTTEVFRSNIRTGEIKDPTRPVVGGVGFIGDGKYRAKVKGKVQDSYSKWTGMIYRCYGGHSGKNKSYLDVSVCDEWHNYQNFAAWYDDNYPSDGGKYDLDKDLKSGDKKIYSPKTCSFLPCARNVEVSHAKEWMFISPSGDKVKVYNLKKFCRENNLLDCKMSLVSSGKRKTHKGWRSTQVDAGKLYDANYRKLTPSQAKAYDDKTEYFGEEYK